MSCIVLLLVDDWTYESNTDAQIAWEAPCGMRRVNNLRCCRLSFEHPDQVSLRVIVKVSLCFVNQQDWFDISGVERSESKQRYKRSETVTTLCDRAVGPRSRYEHPYNFTA